MSMKLSIFTVTSTITQKDFYALQLFDYQTHTTASTPLPQFCLKIYQRKYQNLRTYYKLPIKNSYAY